jgi:UDP-N-acetyl-2-amino-2-deoxyglucuronate dehydrogenase
VFKRANVRWFLSIDRTHLPQNAVQGEKLTYRSIMVEGEEIEFSSGFNDLHTLSYEEILSGNGYRIAENLSAIKIVESIQKTDLLKSSKFKHPLVQKIESEQ